MMPVDNTVVDITHAPTYRSSIFPENANIKSVASGVNIGRIVKEYGPIEIEELDERIAKTQQLLEDLQMEREFLLRMVDIVDDFHQQRKRLMENRK
jgi:hypothetical protein